MLRVGDEHLGLKGHSWGERQVPVLKHGVRNEHLGLKRHSRGWKMSTWAHRSMVGVRNEWLHSIKHSGGRRWALKLEKTWLRWKTSIHGGSECRGWHRCAHLVGSGIPPWQSPSPFFFFLVFPNFLKMAAIVTSSCKNYFLYVEQLFYYLLLFVIILFVVIHSSIHKHTKLIKSFQDSFSFPLLFFKFPRHHLQLLDSAFPSKFLA